MEIHQSARKHGVADEDSLHAAQRFLVAYPLDDDDSGGPDRPGPAPRPRPRGRPPRGSAAAEVVPVRLEPELRAALTARAESDRTNASEVVRQALQAWLDVA